VNRRSERQGFRWNPLLVTLLSLLLMAADPRVAARVDAMSFEPHEGQLTVTLVTTQPIPRFSCALSASTSREVLVEFPEATSRLLSAYDPQSPLVQSATVEADPSGRPGVKIRLLLRDGTFRGVEQTGQGLLLRFDAAPGDSREKAAPEGGDYLIGAGDKLEIAVFGHEDLSKVVEVRADGTINFPMIGDLAVAGRSSSEVDDAITQLLRKDYLVDPQVSVDIKEYQSHWVTILGEVRSPGRYVLKRNMHLIDLLAEAGGATKEAGSEILITRRQRDGAVTPQPVAVERERLMSHENQEANIALSDGDIIAIGEKGAFYIRGEVSRPGSYFIEQNMTILKAISVAGGFTQYANRKEVELLRAGDKGVQARLVINLKAIESGKKQDVPLHANDTVIVPRRIF
jgi:polysaccharide biosynthesis/export protein